MELLLNSEAKPIHLLLFTDAKQSYLLLKLVTCCVVPALAAF